MLRLLGTPCDAPRGGRGARLFLGISAGRVLEEEATCPFIPAPTCLLNPGETGALAAPSYEEESGQFGVKQRRFKSERSISHKLTT